ncbi:MAG: thioredoxin domain-containing protein [Geitlerinemataceae cyanobacterium]
MPNRLAQSASLYLRKHAENPIDWWPWCDEAIATARQDNKPIFLSIGYSSCHWCTVMEGEAFSDPEVAAFLNANFLPIKVDREERPDIDSVYMQALQLMTGQGGWPLNTFLMPDSLVPFYGGTYFGMQPLYGRPSFMQVLSRLRQMFDTELEKLRQVETDVKAALERGADSPPIADFKADFSSDAADTEDSDRQNHDTLQRGLAIAAKIAAPHGRAPSFPSLPYALTALRGVRFGPEEPDDSGEEREVDPYRVCNQRAIDLCLGGIYDHVGGGFHRYTVDATWTVPHFEKMLYDNGLALEFLAELWRAGGREPAFETAIAGTVEWLRREMTDPAGFFYAAQDADNFVTPADAEPEEGAFYVWTWDELKTALNPEELAELQRRFTISPEGNFEGSNVLQRRDAGHLCASVRTALDKLFALRYGQSRNDRYEPARNNREAKTQPRSGRIPPVTDTKAIVAWNALTISGLAKAAAVLHQLPYLTLARGAADFILEAQQVDGRLHRVNYDGQPAVLAQSEDYALFIKALIDLHQACQSLAPSDAIVKIYLDAAIALQAEFDAHLWDDDRGGYDNTDDRRNLIVCERSIQDNATPAPNGIAIANLIRLGALCDNPAYFDRADLALAAFAPLMRETPQACPSAIAALDDRLHYTHVQIPPHWASEYLDRYFPSTAVSVRFDLPKDAAGIVCYDLTCREPASSFDRLFEQIQARLDR